MARFQTTPERAAKIAQLKAYLETIEDGDERAWDRIADETGIPMTRSGRDMVRMALGKRPYESIRGIGLRMSCPESALQIVHHRLKRVNGATVRADSTQQELQRRHLERMSPPSQQRMLMLASFFGAVRVLARDASRGFLKS